MDQRGEGKTLNAKVEMENVVCRRRKIKDTETVINKKGTRKVKIRRMD